MTVYSEKEIQSLIEQFIARTLPKNEWTHEAHLIMSIWHNLKYGEERALELISRRIYNYNETIGTDNSETSGYHETLTRFWMKIANNFLKNQNFPSNAVACNEFLKSDFASKGLPLEFYDEEQLFSLEAKKNWVAPNLKSIEHIAVLHNYMIIEHFRDGKIKEIYDRFEKRGRLIPKGVKFVDSWIDEKVENCYQLMQSDSEEGLQKWISEWEDLTEFEVVRVIDSAEAKRRVFS